MLQFITPIILASSFVLQPVGYTCTPSQKIVYTDVGTTFTDNSLYGYYEKGNIYMCPQTFQYKQHAKFIYIHEYGHYVFDRKMTQEQRGEWFAIRNSQESYVSDYSKSNQYEDFAETFAYILLKKEIPKNDIMKVKVDFIKNILKSISK